MPAFPTGTLPFTNAARTMSLLLDDGTRAGSGTVAQALALITGPDMLTGLLGLSDVVVDIPAATTAYDIVAGDKNRTLRFLNTAACAVRVPAGFSIGYAFDWIQRGAGVLSFISQTGAGQ